MEVALLWGDFAVIAVLIDLYFPSFQMHRSLELIGGTKCYRTI